MSLVLDASVTLAISFEDEYHERAMEIVDLVAAGGAEVPSIWRLEIANAFQTAIRKGRTDSAARSVALADLAAMKITIDLETDQHAWGATLDLADRHGLTVYDAAYLELAQRRRLPLATLDRRLKAAAEAAGVSTLP